MSLYCGPVYIAYLPIIDLIKSGMMMGLGKRARGQQSITDGGGFI